MKRLQKNSIFLVLIVVASGCNTLYNSRVISIDIMEPARVKLPEGYKNLAVRYNNVNVSWNPNTAVYYVDGEEMIDSTNLDSMASHIYFDLFVETLKEQQFFDSIQEIEAADYSKTLIVDTLSKPEINFSDSTVELKDYINEIGAHILASEIKKTNPSPKEVYKKKYLNSKFGLYSQKEISAIADSTSADVLFSFDHFFTENGIAYFVYNFTANEAVKVHYSWTAYDLKQKKLGFHFSKTDTIYWSHSASKTEAMKKIPPRRDAVLNAADIAGTNTAKFLVPHWSTVQRMYYVSGNTEIKPTQELVKQGKWLEAAKVWKANVNSPNKNIAAKCKFNMAVACEMNDQLDAALGWAVESYHVFGEKNEIHAANCRDYIRILSQRKLDVSLLEKQFSSME